MLKNRQIKFLVMLAVVILAAILFMVFRKPSLSLVETNPVNGGVVGPADAQVMFKFSEPLSENGRDLVTVSVSPSVDFLYKYDGNGASITIVLSDLVLSDNVLYTVTLNDIMGEDGAKLTSAQSSFSVDLSDQAVDLLGSLPINNGGYHIEKLQNNALFIYATTDSMLDKAKNYIETAGLPLDKFKHSFSVKDSSSPSWLEQEFDPRSYAD